MRLARTLHLPTGLAMTFACRPIRTPDPAPEALTAEVIALFPQERWAERLDDEAPSSAESTAG